MGKPNAGTNVMAAEAAIHASFNESNASGARKALTECKRRLAWVPTYVGMTLKAGMSGASTSAGAWRSHCFAWMAGNPRRFCH